MTHSTSTIDQVTELFDVWAASDGYPHYQKHEYLKVLDTSSLLKNGSCSVLDVGCGVGFVASALKARNHTVTGLDLSASALNKALTNRLIDHAVTADFLKSGLKSESFDVVVCWGVLMLIFDMKAAIAEGSRLLKPGGQILIVDHYSGNPYVKAHFGRPNWVDLLVEKKSNVARHPLSPQMIHDAGAKLFAWDAPQFHSMFTKHPHTVINTAHSAARLLFSGIRKFTAAPWTGNFMSMSGRKV